YHRLPAACPWGRHELPARPNPRVRERAGRSSDRRPAVLLEQLVGGGDHHGGGVLEGNPAPKPDHRPPLPPRVLGSAAEKRAEVARGVAHPGGEDPTG